VPVVVCGRCRARHHHPPFPVIGTACCFLPGPPRGGRRRLAPLCHPLRRTICLGRARLVGGAGRPLDEARCESASVTLPVRTRARCGYRRRPAGSGGGTTGWPPHVDAGLSAWAGGAVVANHRGQPAASDRLTFNPRSAAPAAARSPGTAGA